MICMEEFAQNDGPRGNFFDSHTRPNNCSCDAEYDYCNRCFIRNFRTNAVQCTDFGCPNKHMPCPTCRGSITCGLVTAKWCESNYLAIDMGEMALRTGGTVTYMLD